MGGHSIGVELHPRGIRVARVQTRAKGIHVHQIAEAAFPDGQSLTSLRAESLPDEIAALLDPRQFGTRPTTVVVDHPSVALCVLSLAEGYTDELSTSVKWYAEQYVPYPVDQAAVDFSVSDSPYGGQKTVFLMALQRSVVGKVLELLPPKRIKLRRIDGVPHALVRLHELAAAGGERREPALLVHASDTRAYFVVVQEGRMEVVRHVRLGDNLILSLHEKARQTCLHFEAHHPTESVVAAYATRSTLARGDMQQGFLDELGIEVQPLGPATETTSAPGRASDGTTDGWAERFALAVGAAC